MKELSIISFKLELEPVDACRVLLTFYSAYLEIFEKKYLTKKSNTYNEFF
jgi:hypothetical protein